MELLYPLRLLSPAGTPLESDSVTVLVNRVVPSVEEQLFQATLKELLEEFDRFPGTSGNMVFRQEVDGDAEFSILKRFAGEANHDAWMNSTGFARWRDAWLRRRRRETTSIVILEWSPSLYPRRLPTHRPAGRWPCCS